MNRQISLLILVLLSAALALSACGTSGGKAISARNEAGAAATLDDYKAQLHEIVRAEILEARREADESSAEVRNYKPHFFKEFYDYPQGVDSFEIAFTEKESRTTPLEADVSLPKLRYSTDVQRDRAAVRADSDYQRERGTETISYELRNGRWHRMGSLFVASEISVMRNGQWVERMEEPRTRLDPFEDDDGWFRRTLNRLRIGDDPGSAAP